MELRQLRYLIGVSEAGSLLKASRLLHVAQPALSQQMAALEAELGTALFVRSSRGMALTENGRRFVEHARIVLSDVERARLSVRSDPGEMEGEVLVGLPTTVALAATLPLLRAVRARYPKVFLRLVESHSGYLREWLQLGRLDLSILFAMEEEAWLVQRPLLREGLCVVGPGRDGSMPETIALRQLGTYPLMLPGQDHGLRRIVDEASAQHGIALDVVAEIDSLPNIKKAVEAGLGFTVLPPAAVSDEVQRGRLQAAALVEPSISRDIVCATSLTRPLTPVASVITELVCEELRKLVRDGHWPASLQEAGDPPPPGRPAGS